ncbi:hypothetical protein QQX98_000031 [Neonectria punicea]|uniref:Ankyrin repeat protein n=1 Tax=Neonectria punicea TaxID=979145 RepID=A0ABR1HWB0_9HYPO
MNLLGLVADVNARDYQKCEPLAFAVNYNDWTFVALLLQHGADVNNQDWEGDVPLFEAVSSSVHKSARILFEYDADYTNIKDKVWGILHHLAAKGDTQMIPLFTETRMRGIDRSLPKLDGKTAMDLLEERPVVSSVPLLVEIMRDNDLAKCKVP